VTLVLFIPHRDGCVLVSDKQNTHRDGSKTEVTKLYLHDRSGPAIGCAGHTLVIQKLYSKLKHLNFTNNEDICNRIKRTLPPIIDDVTKTNALMGPGLHKGELFTEIMVVCVSDGGSITPFHFRGFIDIEVDPSKIIVIPEQSSASSRYQDLDTNSFSEKEATSLGEEILRQTAFSNSTIGSPEYHGFDVITVNRDREFSFSSKPAIVPRRTISESLDYVSERIGTEEEE